MAAPAKNVEDGSWTFKNTVVALSSMGTFECDGDSVEICLVNAGPDEQGSDQPRGPYSPPDCKGLALDFN